MFTASSLFPDQLSASIYGFVIDVSGRFILDGENEILPQPIAKVESTVAAGLTRKHYLGRYDDVDCVLFIVDTPENAETMNNAAYGLRTLFDMWDSDMWFVAGYAWQIFEWDRNHRFCGRCGATTRIVTGERARKCGSCGLVNYPRISPSMIVLIQKDDEILLAKNAQFKRPFYSILAGYVEPGETLYECVEREVFEEVGLKIRNIRFFESQYWPMSGSLMLGCTAEYASGSIRIDEKELSHAAWFKANALPQVPPPKSIAGVMINEFVQRQQRIR